MTTPIRAVCVCVDYADILSITLPYNQHQFQQLLIITSPGDTETKMLCEKEKVPCFVTDLFYRDGAMFNKWLALEEGLNHFGREGWICLLDADVLWPKNAWKSLTGIRPGFLYTPRRRMYPILPKNEDCIPSEAIWNNYPVHRNENEFAGYSQIFHASDPVLGDPPWHEVDWMTAGSADSFFQLKWPDHMKIRPAFEVLHLGPAGTNWAGRVSPYADGTIPEHAKERAEYLARMFRQRQGKSGMRRFDHERIKRDE